jgi:hypothetical protein
METGKKSRWGAIIFRGEEREETRRLHCVEGRRYIKEWRGGQGG